jgi:tetratricopeptide (TPR) repeat protein
MIPLFAIGLLLALFAWFLLRTHFHNRAGERYNAGDYSGALTLYNRLTRFYPRDAMAYRNRALVHMQLGDPLAALQDFEAAIQRSPREIGLRLERATLYAYVGRADDAAKEYDILAQISPENPQVFLNRAWFRTTQGEYQAAIADTEQAESLLAPLKEKSDEFGVHMGGEHLQALIKRQRTQVLSLRGAAYVRLGDFETAYGLYQQALDIAPNDPSLHNDYAEAYFAAGDYQAALARYQQGQALLNDDDAPPQTMGGQTPQEFITAGLAVTYFALSDTRQALDLWRGLLAKNPAYDDAAWVQNELSWTDAMTDTAERIIALLADGERSAESWGDSDSGTSS